MDHTTVLIIQYRYFILIPLAILEGPIAAFSAGTLASLGYFNIYVLGIIFFVRDVGIDLCYYALGHYGGKTKLVEKFLAKIHVTSAHLEGVRRLWDNHTAKTMFIGKLSYGISSTFIVIAGMVKVPLKRFVAYGSMVAVTQYGALLLLGYFFGNSFGKTISSALTILEYIIGAITIVASLYFIMGRRFRTKLLAMEKKEEQEERAEQGSPSGF